MNIALDPERGPPRRPRPGRKKAKEQTPNEFHVFQGFRRFLHKSAQRVYSSGISAVITCRTFKVARSAGIYALLVHPAWLIAGVTGNKEEAWNDCLVSWRLWITFALLRNSLGFFHSPPSPYLFCALFLDKPVSLVMIFHFTDDAKSREQCRPRFSPPRNSR